MQARRKQSSHFIRRALHKEMKRIHPLRIHRIGTRGVWIILQAIHKRARMESSLRVHKMNSRWRSERQPAILRGKTIRRKKTGKQNDAVDPREQDRRGPKFMLVFHRLIPHESADRSQTKVGRQGNYPQQERRKTASLRPPRRTRLARGSPGPSTGPVLASSK